MRRVAVIGNSGGGKSVLARRLAGKLVLACVEIEALLGLPGGQLSPGYEAEHSRQIGRDHWIIEGLGSRVSIPPRLRRATDIVLVDMELWVHFWLAASRQVAWASGRRDDPPGG